ncbi:AAA family ATPase [Paracoccus luteus]|uniref:AAA family ATPase n=1 Tax=Paracoccus luteus TaxID=2508543 RepID=UPI001FE46F8A|nr:AAA family ATPase [Paracoccus luteus]
MTPAPDALPGYGPAGAALLDRIAALGPGRRLVAVAGAPGSGKSTLATALAGHLGAPLVPMDGFHLDNRLLDAASLRPRKGAPETFDADGFAALVERLRGGGAVVHPLFDRTRDLSIAGAAVVPADAGVVVVEGNYLLLDAPGWDRLRWDLSVWIEVAAPELERRLTLRWRDLGCDANAVAAHLANDMANARRVQAGSRAADMVLRPPDP